MVSKSLTVHVVPETHWDRQWYQPFQVMRIRLINLTIHLLNILENDESFTCFVFDGQTVILEDILEVRPDLKKRLKKLVSERRLFVGPWYVLADEYLVSGEALIQNLLFGKRISEAFGHRMGDGYVPDAFGHIAQLPQILKKSGIRSAIFTRGVGNEGEDLGSEFFWKAPDDESSVLAVHQVPEGYGNAARLGLEDCEPMRSRLKGLSIFERINSILLKMKPYAVTPVRLLNNGTDHLEPNSDLPDLIKKLNDHFEDINFKISNYEAFCNDIQNHADGLKTFSGEFHRSRYHPVLSGVFSTRVPLKQANVRVQNLLERIMDPLTALAWKVRNTDVESFRRHAWKLLLLNHPHDDICGCSVDEVHRTNMENFSGALQIGEKLSSEAIASLVTSDEIVDDYEDIYVPVFNQIERERDSWITVTVTIPESLVRGKKIQMEDPRYGPVPTIEIEREVENVSPALENMVHLKLNFFAEELPSMGYLVFKVRVVDRLKKFNQRVKILRNGLENEFLRITVGKNGTIRLEDKQTGNIYKNLLLFEDSEDAGDEYNYSPSQNGLTITTKDAKAGLDTAVESSHYGAVNIRIPLKIPSSLEKNRRRRKSDMRFCPLCVILGLSAGSKRLEIDVNFENNAEDHRLRVHFPTGADTNNTIAESAFTAVKRPVDLPSDENWAEPPSKTSAQLGFSAAYDGSRGLAVFTKGLYEYEGIKESDGTVSIAVTLLRCVGWLSRSDLITRRNLAGPQYATPEAQCPGSHLLQLAVMPLNDGIEGDDVFAEVRDFALQPFADMLNRPLFGIKPEHFNKSSRKVETERSFIRIPTKGIQLSTLKRSEDCKALILRVFNATSKTKKTTIELSGVFKKVLSVNLMEEKPKKVSFEGGVIKDTLKSWAIHTYRLE